MLWHVEYSERLSRVYYGDKDTIRKLLVLQAGIKGFDMLEEYSPRTHGFVAVPDSADHEFNKEWSPKTAGNIVKYEGKLWRVRGFNDHKGMMIVPENSEEGSEPKYLPRPSDDGLYEGVELIMKYRGNDIELIPEYNTLDDLSIDKLEDEYKTWALAQAKRKSEIDQYYRKIR